MIRAMNNGNVGGIESFGDHAVRSGSAEAPRRVSFRFTGSASEYFSIWIVNVLLSIVTLGIYSAWAKVRAKQYFYRHTYVDRSSFEYTANPLSILKGRLIIGAFLVLLAASQAYDPTLYLLLAVVFLLATPYLIVQSLRFNARNSAYRNIRFSFAGTVGEAYGVFALTWFLTIISCGLAYPYALWRLTQFYVTRHLYGDERLNWSATASQYYKIFLLPALVQFALLAGAGGLFALFQARGGDGESNPDSARAIGLLVFLAAVGFYSVLFAIAAYVKARTTNLLFNELKLGPHGFQATQRARDLLLLYFTNALCVIVSLGLLSPWARVRVAKYKADHLELAASGPLVGGANPMAQSASALGDAATDLGDIGFDVGF